MDSQKPTRDEALLSSVAESIGSTLGVIAAKAGAVQKAISKKMSSAKPHRATKSRARKVATRRKRSARPSGARRVARNKSK